MDTPEDQASSYRYAEECRRVSRDPTNDSQFSQCADLLMWLIHKYGRRVIRLLLDDYRVKKKETE